MAKLSIVDDPMLISAVTPDPIVQIDILHTFIPGWTIRGSWNSKIHVGIDGRFELTQNNENHEEFELRLNYSATSVYCANEARAWLLTAIVRDREILLKSKNFGFGQYVVIHLKEGRDSSVWFGEFISLNPTDVAGLAGIC
jgi:hypothetical protein